MVLKALVIILAFCQAVRAYPAQKQKPLAQLHGRFLHITDIHPDPYYKVNASVSSACHRNKPKNEAARAGYWGTAWGSCDTPLWAVNRTFEYLEQTWADRVDFVLWTGDSARHDNDREQPRTPTEIYDLNRMVAERMEETFSERGIPVVPSLGNNDVWPHNILAAGPNPTTNAFVNIWERFVPFASYQVFQRGGYFSVEVIPNRVGVISLNTMYFYESNKAVRGCVVGEDPGNLELDWLEVQLGLFRERGVRVYVIGHVPPSEKNYYGTCFERYSKLAIRYQETIIGHVYGHMNVDHFYFLRAGEAETAKKKSLAKKLRKEFAGLAKDARESEYGVVWVSPSVVANPYVPSLRVFSYGESGPMGYEQYYMPTLEKWELEYGTEEYGMEDLSVKSWLALGRRLGKDDELWRVFVQRMEMGGYL